MITNYPEWIIKWVLIIIVVIALYSIHIGLGVIGTVILIAYLRRLWKEEFGPWDNFGNPL